MCAKKEKLRLDQKGAEASQASGVLSAEDAREVFNVPVAQPTHGGARGKRGKHKKVVFEAAFSGTTESYQELVFPLLCSLGAIPVCK